MTTHEIERVWELMQSLRFCMLTTWNGNELRSRPMGAFVRRNEHAIYFFTDERAHKDDEIRQHPKVLLGFADTHRQKYVTVSGKAEISASHDKIKELWSAPTKVWWKTPDDPEIRLIKVTPEEAEYWDTPGNLVSDFKVAFAIVTGTHLDPGEHKKVHP